MGAILLYPNGAIQHIGGGIHLQGSPYHPFDYRSDVRGRNKPTKLPPQIKTNRAVPYVTGACLLIKRSTISKVGFLDEGFRLGFGDVDYGLSVVMAGLKNMVCADVVLMHRWAYTMRKLKHKTLVHEWPSSTKRYFSKWKHRINELNKLVKIEW